VSPALFANIPRVMAELEGFGWCDTNKATHLAAIVLAIRPNVGVEIGVYGGRSLIPMLMAVGVNGRGKFYAIDPWSAEASQDGYDGPNKEWWGKLDHEAVYQKFTTTMAKFGVSEYAHVIRKRSDDFEPPEVIDLLHIDGQHTDQAVRDAERYGSRVRLGGFCVTDDDDWEAGGPQAAVALLMKKGFVPLYKLGTGTVFQRLS
jgi:hypothetical protein